MNKILTTLLVLGLTTTTVFAQGCPQCGAPFNGPQGGPPPCGMHRPCGKMPSKVNLDEKLNLTDKQKEQAKQLRKEGREQMEPIMNSIRTKQEQKELIKHSKDITTEAKLEQVEKLNNQINELHKQARDLRLKHERDFESILTQKQKKELDKIKADKRKAKSKSSKTNFTPKK